MAAVLGGATTRAAGTVAAEVVSGDRVGRFSAGKDAAHSRLRDAGVGVIGMPFTDRRDAGRKLAGALEHFRHEDAVILGLPRGGVVVAYEVAVTLNKPLDVLVVRKLGHPAQPELGIGAIGEEGITVLNEHLVAVTRVTPEEIEWVKERERAELERRVRAYRGDRPACPVEGRVAIVVDDGVATGFTARAAIEIVRQRGPRSVVLAVPVAPPSTVAELREVADDVVAVETPEPFAAIGQWYLNFTQTGDDEVVGLLEAAGTISGVAAVAREGADDRGAGVAREEGVAIPIGAVTLPGDLTVPPGAGGIVVFAHGSGSSRLSPRNRAVANVLHQAGLATLLFDLLTDAEAADRANVFDIPLLGSRLLGAARWVRQRSDLRDLPLAYFGASTGAAAALWAAAEQAEEVGAIVSRGGRPDLAAGRLARVRAPTLLVVGERDEVVLELNREAQKELTATSALEVVPGATHLFEEPGALERAAELARDWFVRHLLPDGHGA